MGKHATNAQKIELLTRIEYIHLAAAARLVGLSKSTAQGIKDRAAALMIKHEEKGLPPPTLLEQATRKAGSGAKPKISIAEVTSLLEACTIDKKQRKKL